MGFWISRDCDLMSAMLRLFAALPVPETVSARLSAWQQHLDGARWRPAEAFHVTLCFYGELTHEQAVRLDEVLGGIDAEAFDLEVKGVGWFGTRQVQSVWARISETEALDALAARCRQAAHRLGMRIDRHPFTPHVTLAYMRAGDPQAVHLWAARHHAHPGLSFRATHFHLYSSRRTSGDISRYEAVADYPLTGAGMDW